MVNLSFTNNQIKYVTSFDDFISEAFHGDVNAIGWKRELSGDFQEIVRKLESPENITVIEENELTELELSEKGQVAREILLSDYQLLKAQGASPSLNIIKYYESDEEHSFFPTDVYSFHVDRSPIPTETILCTYHGESSDILPNSQAEQKIHIPEIRNKLRKQFIGPDEEFESYLVEHFFDLHYQTKPNAQIFNLGLGNLWKLSVDHPDSNVMPCIHRAPKEKNGVSRLLLIC